MQSGVKEDSEWSLRVPVAKVPLRHILDHTFVSLSGLKRDPDSRIEVCQKLVYEYTVNSFGNRPLYRRVS